MEQSPPPPAFSRLKHNLAAPAFKFVFAAALMALAFAATYTSSAEAFSELDFRQIVLLGAAVNAVLLIGPAFLPVPKALANAVLTLVTLASIATAYLIHTDLYLAGNKAVFILMCAGCGAGLFVAFQVIDQLRWGGAALPAAALLTLAVIAGGHLAGAPTPVSGDTANIRHVAFRETPNLYFVSFESMAPRPLLNKYLDLETTEFHDLFAAEFRRFPNFFANSARTTHSLNTILALDTDVYASQLSELQEKGSESKAFLFSGQNPSPLLAIIRENGYETTTIYVDNYLGKRKGPYVDHYITLEKNTVCHLLDPSIREWAFWRYCRFFDGKYDRDNRPTVEQITKVSANGGPQFVMAHLYVPGHVNTRTFRWGDTEQLEKFKARYVKQNAEAARYLELILQHLKANDPNAILLVYGDHGVLQSYELDYYDHPVFVVQDHYGILGGVYPPDTCAVWFDAAAAQGYMTILDAVHALLRCLSGGESALVEPREYARPGYGPGAWDANLNYKEFLYE